MKQVLPGIQPLNELKDKQAYYHEIRHSSVSRSNNKIQRTQLQYREDKRKSMLAKISLSGKDTAGPQAF